MSIPFQNKSPTVIHILLGLYLLLSVRVTILPPSFRHSLIASHSREIGTKIPIIK